MFLPVPVDSTVGNAVGQELEVELTVLFELKLEKMEVVFVLGTGYWLVDELREYEVAVVKPLNTNDELEVLTLEDETGADESSDIAFEAEPGNGPEIEDESY
jgi:hypothetical protein